MKACLNCKTQIVSSNCIVTEQELSFEYDSFDDVLVKLDKATGDLKNILSAKIDKKSVIKSEHTYVTEYIQDLVNQIELINMSLNKSTSLADSKILINSTLVSGEKTITQLFSILFKEVETLKTNKSSLYLA